MKKLIIALIILNILISCKKSISNTKSNSNSNNCIDNPLINFATIGTPIGKFDDCITDVDGNVYKTVTIGTQTWMAENLKTSKYNDGNIIPNITDNFQWKNNTTGAWCYYNNEKTYNEKYGKLYNWYVLFNNDNNNKNICPSGWHIPTSDNWHVLYNYLKNDSLSGGLGEKMKSITNNEWVTPNLGATNTSLFTGLPSGSRDGDGFFGNIGMGCYWWCAPKYSNDFIKHQTLTYETNDLKEIMYNNGNTGFSVRCLKD